MLAKQLYEFGSFRLDAAERLLRCGGEVVPLTPKVFEVLALLVENSGHLLEREALLAAVWADSFVEEANLTVSISALRKALGEGSNGHRYIETVPKRGYRFVADVRVFGAEQEKLISHEQTAAQLVIQQEEEKDDQSEIKAEIEASGTEQAKAHASKRVKLQALIACATMIVTMAGVAVWWKSIKTRQTETNTQIRSIAVLPFKQLSASDGSEILGLGMADVLITRLGSFNQITVRPTSAVFKYTSAEQDLASAGHDLKVESVLDGSIQKLDGRIRVTAKLVRVQDGSLMWADTFDGRSADIFAVEDAISERLVTALALKPTGNERKLLTKRYTESAEAYQSYMRGRYFWNKRTREGWEKAIEYFEQAIRMDQDYGLAYAGLADCYSLLVNYCQLEPKEAFPRAKEAALRALGIDDTLAEAHASLAKILHLFDWNWEDAEKEFKRAIELKPNYATGHQWYGEYLISMGRFDEAKTEMNLALENDPVSLAINVAQGFPYYYGREYDEAIAAYKKALELDPSFASAHLRLYHAYVQKQIYDEAIAEYAANYSSLPEIEQRIKTDYAASGMTGFWEEKMAATPEQDVPRCSMYFRAQVHALVGARDKALRWLERCYDSRDHSLTVLKVDPAFDNLRSEPRFRDLLRRMRLDP